MKIETRTSDDLVEIDITAPDDYFAIFFKAMGLNIGIKTVDSLTI